ncbi:LOW QUALITY PROTEIN: mas-related G-protein coupled receptor member H-like, partial [Sceloporus undulatus]|uniref:LOW QUALITY PROTEIN: mas-related G-protein coupled receptor member H-like n=1 Tax=Sceloporus undulatus TaxID=8520 RepID=UPI001C4DC576
TGEKPYSGFKFYIGIVILVICFTGFIGNGAVIWLLGFCIKRNPFTTYILNLAVADVGVLTAIASRYILIHTRGEMFLLFLCLYLFLFMFTTSQILLTSISIDRCVTVLFPMWHRYHRPTHLSTIVCAFIWLLSFLLSAVILILDVTNSFVYNDKIFYCFLITSLFCLPLMTISAVTLFIKVYCKSHQRQRQKLMTILLTLLFFVMFDFPFNTLLLIHLSFEALPSFFFTWSYLCACLNSSVNPLIYFLVGKKKGGRSKESMKLILQRVLNEEEDCRHKMEDRIF